MVIRIHIIYFQTSIFFPSSSCPQLWQLYRKARFLSNWCTFTFTHSAIPQVKGNSGHWKKKIDCITQCAELLILNKTWDTLRKMQNNFSHPMCATVFLKTMREFTFWGFDVEAYCSIPCSHWFTVVFSPSISTGMHFFYSIYLSCSLGMQHPFSSAKQASMLASFNMTGFQHFDKDATVTSVVLGASVVSL